LAARVDVASAPEHNAKLETMVIERMKPEDQELLRQRHPVMETQSRACQKFSISSTPTTGSRSASINA